MSLPSDVEWLVTECVVEIEEIPGVHSALEALRLLRDEIDRRIKLEEQPYEQLAQHTGTVS